MGGEAVCSGGEGFVWCKEVDKGIVFFFGLWRFFFAFNEGTKSEAGVERRQELRTNLVSLRN